MQAWSKWEVAEHHDSNPGPVRGPKRELLEWRCHEQHGRSSAKLWVTHCSWRAVEKAASSAAKSCAGQLPLLLKVSKLKVNKGALACNTFNARCSRGPLCCCKAAIGQVVLHPTVVTDPMALHHVQV